MLLWAQTQEERKKWITAFQKIEKEEPPVKDRPFWIEMSAENFMSVSLYRCLMPASLTATELRAQSLPDNPLEGFVRIAEHRVEPYQENPFVKSFVRLNTEALTLQVCNAESAEATPNQEIDLRGTLRQIDSELQNNLIFDHTDLFEDGYLGDGHKLELPADEYQFPLALIFESGEIFLMWTTSLEDLQKWKSTLSKLVIGAPTGNNFLVRSEDNYFMSTVFRCLERKVAIQEQTAEDSKSALYETKQEQRDDEVAGWMFNTLGKNITTKDEPFIYHYFRLDMSTGILSEYQTEDKSLKLIEYPLCRKIMWVETNLSNELKTGYTKAFTKLGCDVPENFQVPNDKLRPIALHLADGDVLLMWTAKRDFGNWLSAFTHLQIQSLNPDERQKIFIKVTPSNCFTVSVFQSILPIEAREKEEADYGLNQSQFKGACMRTAKNQSGGSISYAVKRFYHLDNKTQSLKISYEAGGKATEVYDLKTLSWSDSSLTKKYIEGHRQILQEDKINMQIAEEFYYPESYNHPLAIVFEDGDLLLLWFEQRDECDTLDQVCKQIESKKLEQTPGHKYIIKCKQSEFVASIFRVLKPKNESDIDPRIIKGELARAMNKRQEMFRKQYVLLDTRTAMIRFYYDDKYLQLDEEHELRFARSICDLDNSIRSVSVGPITTIDIPKASRAFGFHNCGGAFLFLASNEEDYQKWTKAIKMIEVTKYNQLQMWVDRSNQPSNLIKVIHTLSPKIEVDKPQLHERDQLSGFLCKTCQVQSSVSNKIFYKRFYSIDYVKKELIVRLKEGNDVKEKFDLTTLVQVDKSLNHKLCPDYQSIVKITKKMALPKEFAHPFALHFNDGIIQLLWASSQEMFEEWTNALESFQSEQNLKYQMYIRHQLNFFACNFYLCLVPERPTILQETKFQQRRLEDVLNEHAGNNLNVPLEDLAEQHKSSEQFDELAQAMVSSRGVIEGWLYKTSQKLGFFQQDIFHRRFYRLNLMTEDLKIFDKPDGSLKHTLNLSKKVVKIDTKLNTQITSDIKRRIGASINLPPFNYPFAIFTEKDCLLLWAQTRNEQTKWVESFTSLQNGTDPEAVSKFKVSKGKNNKIVVGLYECLKISSDLVDPKTVSDQKRGRTVVPGRRANPTAEGAMNQIGHKITTNETPEKVNTINLINQKSDILGGTPTSPKVKDFKLMSELDQLDDIPEDQPMLDGHQFQIDLPKDHRRAPSGVNNFTIEENKVNQGMPPTPARASSQRGKGKGKKKKGKRRQDSSNMSAASAMASDVFSQGTTEQHIGSEMPLFTNDNDSVMQWSETKNLETDQYASEIQHSHRRSGRYRQMSSAEQMAQGPIKIKQINSTPTQQKRFDEGSVRQSVDIDYMDDDIDIPISNKEPTFQVAKKIKVKLKNRTTNQTADVTEQQRNSINSSLLAFGPQQQENFEEKVKGQIDHNFIDSLIKSASKSSLGQNTTRFSNVADELREQIKSTNEKSVLQSGRGPMKAMQMRPLVVDMTDESAEMAGGGLSGTGDLTQVLGQVLHRRSNAGQAQSHRGVEQAAGEEGSASDWDENDERQRKRVGSRRRNSSTLVNVRDRTAAAQNVFSGQDIGSARGDGSARPMGSARALASARAMRSARGSSSHRDSARHQAVPQEQITKSGAQSYMQNNHFEAADESSQLLQKQIQQLRGKEEGKRNPANGSEFNAENYSKEGYNSVWD